MKKFITQALDMATNFLFFAIAVVIAYNVITSRVTFDAIASVLFMIIGLMGVHELSRIRRALEKH